MLCTSFFFFLFVSIDASNFESQIMSSSHKGIREVDTFYQDECAANPREQLKPGPES